MSDEAEARAAERDDLAILGRVLLEARMARDWSLRAAARALELNPMQLSRLERGASKRPSPHTLYQLGRVLDLPYADLMRLAGYATPTGSGDEAVSSRADEALGAEGLLLRAAAPFTEDELEAMLAFLRFYRERNSAHIQPHASEAPEDQPGVGAAQRPHRKRTPRVPARPNEHAS